jgi:phage terminase Nu1 subunit (DNA packaging protein)
MKKRLPTTTYSPPTDYFIRSRQLGEILSLSERRISDLVKSGVIPPSSPCGYRLAPSVRGYIDFLRKERGSLSEERTLLTRAKRLKAELELRQREGALIERETVREDSYAAGRRVRDQLLTIPDRVAGLCAAEQDQSAVHRILDKEILNTLTEIGSWSGKYEANRT